MTFNDIFKSSFLESVTEFSVVDTLIGLAFALVIGLYIFMVYKKTLTGVLYSESFALTLVGLSCVTALVIMAVTSNVVLSLGMVGALSIVRFRAAIKEPIEIVFLFWAIAAGIVVGAGMIPLAVIGSAIIGLILIFFAGRKTHDRPYILVLNCTNEAAEAAARDLVKASSSRFVIKSKVVNAAGIELTAEVRVREAETAFVNRVNDLPDVTNASLVSYNGDYMA
ncbi:MAG: DUF4956 domain-containing protein [Eubacteriales bacterium]|nr:DUF4956 domain-containing protein [bacterium]MDY2793488.1 DUF4956 domain-containing protein [Eubacteriales bacterium]